MLVLGKNTDDKGAQLEKLTQSLLTARNYRNICRNWVGPGGDEIDVRAEYPVPSLRDPKTFKVICECKAYKSVVDLPQWLKFCGKLFVEQHTQSPDTQGCFIALSGVNGNVRGNYDELKKHDAKVELVAGDDLLDLVRQVYSLPDLKAILEHVKRLTDRVQRGSEVVYYDDRVYWLLLFEHDAYALLKGNGDGLTDDEVAGLREMIEEAVSASQYVNLHEEARAKLRALAAEAAVIGSLMLSGGTSTVADIVGRQQELTQQDIEKAVAQLLERHAIDGYTGQEVRLPDDDYMRVTELYRLLFRTPCPVEVLGCAWYDAHINREFVEVVRTVQNGLPLSEADIETTVKLLQLSPTALGHALRRIDVIAEHRQGFQAAILPPEMDQMDRDYFLKVLCDSLQRDFTSPVLAEYFYETRNIRELELTGAHILKSQTGVAVQQDYRQRLILGILEATGRPARMLARNDLPQPWEEARPPSRPPAPAPSEDEGGTTEAKNSAPD